VRALWFDGPGDLAWKEVPDAAIVVDTDAIVRPLAVARCDLDPAIAAGLYPMPAPFGFGHEMAGEIVEVGSSVTAFEVGDRVIVPFQISCGTCAMCARGLTNACAAVPAGSAFGLGRHGHLDFGGALADLVRVPFADQMLIALPAGITAEVAAGIPDNVSDGYRCVAAPLAALPGSPVLVVGGLAQSVGLYAVAAAVALGAAEVRYVDHEPGRLASAERLGAHVEDRRPDQLEVTDTFPITVDASAFDSGRDHALRSTSPCGHCTSVSGGVSRIAALPLQQMYLKGVTYDIGRVHARAVAPAVLDLVAAGRLDPLALDHQVLNFDDAPETMTSPDIKIVYIR
jgi:threonine dehydrogenase-like Zn-dependent dehydrogenase